MWNRPRPVVKQKDVIRALPRWESLKPAITYTITPQIFNRKFKNLKDDHIVSLFTLPISYQIIGCSSKVFSQNRPISFWPFFKVSPGMIGCRTQANHGFPTHFIGLSPLPYEYFSQTTSLKGISRQCQIKFLKVYWHNGVCWRICQIYRVLIAYHHSCKYHLNIYMIYPFELFYY